MCKTSNIFIKYFIICSFLNLNSLAFAKPSPVSDGKIEFSSMVHDFGTVRRGNKLVQVFSFKNVGTAPFTVTGVHAACGCAVTKFEANKEYGIGDSGNIEVTLDTTNFTGSIVKIVTVMTSERLIPTRNLTLKAFVESDFSVDRPVLDFEVVAPGSTPEREVNVSAISKEKYKIEKLRFEKKWIDASLAEQGDRWQIKVQLKAGLPAGNFKETLYLVTNSPALKEIPILIRAEVVGSMKLTPDYLEFGALTPQQTVAREITVSTSGNFSINSTNSEININGTKVENVDAYLKIDKKDPSGTLVATLTHPATSSGSVHGRINVLTSDPTQNKVSIDFYAFFKE